MAPLGRSLGASPSAVGTLSGGSLGTTPLGGSLGKGSLGGITLGRSLGKNSLNGSVNIGSKAGLGIGGRFPTVEKHKDPFQQAPLGIIKDPPGVSTKYSFGNSNLDEVASRARNFLFNSLVPSDKCNAYFTCLDHKTTCPKKSATAIQG